MRRAAPPHPTSAGPSPIVRLWLLRMLVLLDGHREFVDDDCLSNGALAHALGLDDWIISGRPYSKEAARASLRRMHKDAERKATEADIPQVLQANIRKFTLLMGLSDLESRILALAVMMHTDSLLQLGAEQLELVSTSRALFSIAVLLQVPEDDVRAAFSSQSKLPSSGILDIYGGHGTRLDASFDFASNKFAECIRHRAADPLDLLSDRIRVSQPPNLQVDDFAHVAMPLNIMLSHLRHGLSSRRSGINILLHGAPGTGKTQLARLLAHSLGLPMYEVTSANDQGDPIDGPSRLKAYRIGQSILSNKQVLIMFDEIEDVIDAAHRSRAPALRPLGAPLDASKAWINRILEENSVPTIWISNSIDALDPAYARRFDIVTKMPIPSARQRASILEQQCGTLLGAASIARLAQCEAISPALVARAANVVTPIQGELGTAGTELAIQTLIDGTLEAQGHRIVRRATSQSGHAQYQPELTRADTDLLRLANGLRQSPSGRICLYGPPGTGKTAFAQWLSKELDLPLLTYRASDLLSQWVGGTEKKIAAAFETAERERCVFLIDEVDGFLQSRQGSHYSWEVSQVNEMLCQLEQFEGLFIGTTNLLECFDSAVMRRFDLKVKFDYLSKTQARALLGMHCALLDIPPPTEAQLERLDHLGCLTPGDFSTIVRQNRFRPVQSCSAILGGLEAECRHKPGSQHAIGFLRH